MEEHGIALLIRPREAPMLVPAVAEEPEPAPPIMTSERASRRRNARAGTIEVEVAGAVVDAVRSHPRLLLDGVRAD